MHGPNLILDRHVYTYKYKFKKPDSNLNVNDVHSLCGDHPEYLLIGGMNYTISIAKFVGD